MLKSWAVLGLLAVLTGVSSLAAQAPANATAKCKDDTYSTSTSHPGACKGHGGVAEWLTQEKTATKAETVTCADGSTSKPGKGACSHHGGVVSGESKPIVVKAAPEASANVTCKDGTTSKPGKGACSHHGGVAADAAAAREKTNTATKAETVTCTDGTTSKPGKGACLHHGGVGTAAAPAAAPANPPAAIPGNPPVPVTAKANPTAPADATALCKDGTYSHAQHHRAACSKHGGVDKWLKDVPK